MENRKRGIYVGLDLNDRTPAGERRNLSLLLFADRLGRLLRKEVAPIFASGETPRDETELLNSLPPSLWEALERKSANGAPSAAPLSFLRGPFPGELRVFVESRKRDTELLLLGMGEETRSLFSGHTGEEILRDSRRPLAILGPVAQNATPPEELLRSTKQNPLRLLVATDLGRTSRPVECYALSFSRRTGASVTLLHSLWSSLRSMEESALQSGMVPLEFEELNENIASSALRSLKEKSRRFEERGVPCDFILDTAPRPSHQSILHYQSGHALIFMGTRGRHRLWNLLTGSALRSTLPEARLPVIAVRGG